MKNNFFIRWLINSLALYAAIRIVPGIEAQSMHWLALLGLGLIFGALNAFLRPLLKLLTCPLILLTLGLFTLLINTAMFALAGWVGSFFNIGFSVADFWTAFLGAVVTSLVSIALSLLVGDGEKKKKE